MRKTWIRNLLVLVLALILVFTFAACNKDKDKNNPQEPEEQPAEGYTAADYFDSLWGLSSSIGNEAIGENDDIAAHFNVQITLDMVKANPVRGEKTTFEVTHSMDLGLDVQAVLGRTDNTKTGVKVKIYDPTDTEYSEIATLYVLGSDVDSLYIDFAGKHIKVQHDLVSLVYNEIMENDEPITALINKLLNDKLKNKEGNPTDKSANDYLNAIVGNFGPNWNLNNLINDILGAAGLNLKNLINDNETIKGALTSMLQISVDDLFDSNGNVNLIKVLKSNTIGKFFSASKTTKNGVNTYECEAGSTITGLIEGFLPLFNNKGTGSADYNGLKLVHVEKGGKLDSFAIKAKLGGLKYAIAGEKKYGAPELTLKIQDLSVKKLNANNGLSVNPVDYKSNIALNDTLSVGLKGVKIKNQLVKDLLDNQTVQDMLDKAGIDTSKIDTDEIGDINFNGRVEIGLVGQLDLTVPAQSADEEVAPVENQTKINVYARLYNSKPEGEVLQAEGIVSFVNGYFGAKYSVRDDVSGKLVVKGGVQYDKKFDLGQMVHDYASDVAHDIIDNKTPAGKAFWNALVKIGDDFLEEEGIEIDKNKGQEVGGASAEEGEKKFSEVVAEYAEKIKAVLTPVLARVSMDNNISANVDGVLELIVECYNACNNTVSWTVENRTNAILKAAHGNSKQVKPDFTSLDEAIAAIKAAADKKKAEKDKDKATTADEVEYTLGEAIVKTLCYVVNYDDTVKGKYVEVAGVTVPNDSNMYDEIIKAGLGAKVSLSLDAKGGFHVNLSANLKDNTSAAIEIHETLNCIETDADTFVDVYGEYLALVEKGADVSDWKDFHDILQDIFEEEE